MIEFRKFIARKNLQFEPEKLFVFGDNMIHEGYGGQAKAMRGEQNAIGIPTKKFPSMVEKAFFNDSNEDYLAFIKEVRLTWEVLLTFEGTIVWPYNDIGTGRAQLQQRAPRIWQEIQELKEALIDDQS